MPYLNEHNLPQDVDVQPMPSDLHQLLDEVHSIDTRIRGLIDQRTTMLRHYQERMKEYEKHHHEVATRLVSVDLDGENAVAEKSIGY